MKYVITGSLGNISRPIVKRLVEAGHDVTVISSSDSRSQEIKNLGATPLIGSVDNVHFISNAFAGADAVYTMVPPHFGASNWKKYIADVGRNYAEALRKSNVKYVVNLSSIGAHLAEKVGPVNGLHEVENALNSLEGVNVLHLRAGFFFSNFYANIGMIKGLGIVGGNFGAHSRIIMVHTNDIAEVAADALLTHKFTGKSVVYVVSDEKTTDEIASILGRAVGKPDLSWVDFTDEQNVEGMVQAGLPSEVANNYTEMGAAMRSGIMFEDYVAKRHKPVGKITFENFAEEFAGAYNA